MSPMSILTQSNALHIPLPNGVVNVMCASPPYYRARKYKGAQDYDWPACRFSTPYCSEWSGQLGWEPTPDIFIAHLVAIMSEVKRVLAPTGVAWVVIGDKYVGSEETSMGLGAQGQLLLIPHRLALALQTNGWLVRNDLVWSKSSANPESVAGWRYRHRKCKCTRPKRATEGKKLTNFPGHPQSTMKPTAPDPNCPVCKGTGYLAETQLVRGSWRHTRAHEYVLMLTKRMGYYADHLAAGVPAKCKDWSGIGPKSVAVGKTTGARNRVRTQITTNPTVNPRTVLTPKPYYYKGSHSAPFNPDLIGPLLRATCPSRVCTHCGEPWAPYIEHGRVQKYRPTCDCQPSECKPGLVLDPFAGSGTTGLVCKELGLNFVGMDVSWDYLRDQAQLRVQGKMPRDSLEGLPMFNNTRSTP
jgi:hypothetical protein